MNAPLGPNDHVAYPDADGRFGDFGGRYVPETLMPLVYELDAAYHAAKADPAFNAELDGQAGIQELAGNATLLYYLSDEAKEGRNAYMEKRQPDFSKFPKFP